MERKKRKKERKRIDGCGELLKLVFAFNKVPRRTRSALRIGLEIRYFQLSKLGLVIRINPRRNEPRVFADQWTVNFSHSFAPFHNRFVNWSAAVLPPPPPLFRPRLCKNRAQGMRWFTVVETLGEDDRPWWSIREFPLTRGKSTTSQGSNESMIYSCNSTCPLAILALPIPSFLRIRRKRWLKRKKKEKNNKREKQHWPSRERRRGSIDRSILAEDLSINILQVFSDFFFSSFQSVFFRFAQ